MKISVQRSVYLSTLRDGANHCTRSYHEVKCTYSTERPLRYYSCSFIRLACALTNHEELNPFSWL